MAKDIFTVLAKYNKEVGSSVSNKVGIPSPAPGLKDDKGNDIIFVDYATAYATTKQVFAAQQAEFKKDLTTKVGHPDPSSTKGETLGYFNAFEGLPPELPTNLAQIQCNRHANTPNSASIIGWYSPTAEPKDRYIVTQCRFGTSSKWGTIKSKYYYEAVKSSGGNTPVNMMGVPMASDYLNKNSGYGEETTKEKITRPSTLKLIVPISSSYGAEENTFAFSVSPPFRRTSQTGVYVPFIPEDGANKGYTYFSKKAAYVTLKPNQILLELTNPYDDRSSTEDFVRYTDTKGFSYIWKHRIEDAYASKNHYMRCVSADCSVTDQNHRLSFKDGPQSIWFLQKHNPHMERYYDYTIGGVNIE